MSADGLSAEIQVERGEGEAWCRIGAFMESEDERVGCGRQFLTACADWLQCGAEIYAAWKSAEVERPAT